MRWRIIGSCRPWSMPKISHWTDENMRCDGPIQTIAVVTGLWQTELQRVQKLLNEILRISVGPPCIFVTPSLYLVYCWLASVVVKCCAASASRDIKTSCTAWSVDHLPGNPAALLMESWSDSGPELSPPARCRVLQSLTRQMTSDDEEVSADDSGRLEVHTQHIM